MSIRCGIILKFIRFYYIPINDTTFELSVFRLSDTDSRINELRFSDSVSLFFKARLTSVTCFCVKHGARDVNHDDVTSPNMTG